MFSNIRECLDTSERVTLYIGHARTREINWFVNQVNS